MIITRIEIKNFQAHEYLKLELDEFTAVVGPSSSGKSAILRALSWLFYGDWDKTYPNDPEKTTIVAIALSNGAAYSRFRKGSKNWAVVRKPGEKPQPPFQDFGDVIPGLLEDLNIKPIKIGDKKINLNFSNQDDPVFMINESKPTKAQWIGRLYGAHIINQMLREMSKDKRAAESERKAAEEEVAKLQKDLSKYADIPQRESALERIGESMGRLAEFKSCQTAMWDVMKGTEEIKKYRTLLKTDLKAIRDDVELLGELVELRRDRDLIEVLQRNLERSRGLLGVDLNKLKADVLRYQEIMEARVAKSKLALLDKEHKCGLALLVQQLSAHMENLKDVVFKDGECPLCNHKSKKISREKILINLKTLMGGSDGA